MNRVMLGGVALALVAVAGAAVALRNENEAVSTAAPEDDAPVAAKAAAPARARAAEPSLRKAATPMAERVAAHPEIMRRRKAIIEHVFGTIKRGMGFTYFLCRGFKKVGAELSLTVLAYNLKRAINLLGVGKLIAALG